MTDKEIATFKVVLRTKEMHHIQGDDFNIDGNGAAILRGNKTVACFAPGAWESIVRVDDDPHLKMVA